MAEDQPTGTKERSISGRATAHGREEHFRREAISIAELLKRSNLDDLVALEAQNAPDASPDLPLFDEPLRNCPAHGIDLLGDVDLDVKVILGRTQLTIEEVLHLTDGSVVQLQELAGDPVDVFVNDRLIARGEIVVVNDNFSIRVIEILAAFKEHVE
jgi:flagellar motor switch protein FliN